MQHEFTGVRDCLLSQVAFKRQQIRSSGKQTVHQVKEARMADGHHVQSAVDHKTSGVHDPEKIVLTPVVTQSI
jgi:hypothetical protein